MTPDISKTVRTTCAYCGVGCGITASIDERGQAHIAGDTAHPANFGRLCAKGASLGDSLITDGRLRHPEINGRQVTWDTAITRVANQFGQMISEFGPESVGFYVSGQLLTEDYYVANKLMKGFIGAANIDTNSRLCMASSVAAHKRAFGEDVVPGIYADFEIADVVILVGSNLSWCHPVLHQRLLKARERRGTNIVVIDPRATTTTEVCDLHLAIQPGSDVALFNGLLSWLDANHLLNRDYVNQHTNGFDAALAAAKSFDLERVAALTGLNTDAIRDFFHLFANHKATTTVYSQGVNQSRCGTDKVNAIINCHLATGRVGLPGASPFSITGQPNAMGGREVGGLANTLAAHIDFDDAVGHASVAQFWSAPNLAKAPGLKAVDMFDALGDGRIKALWIMGTNPMVSMPATADIGAALNNCPFVVVSDVMRQTDTTAYADVLLPALGWGEKDGTVTNSERCVSRQRAFAPAPADARADWWIISAIARRMGFSAAFAYDSPAQIFNEYTAMTQLDSAHDRALKMPQAGALSEAEYTHMQPHSWPRPAHNSSARLFGSGRFSTPDQRARFVAVQWHAPAEAVNADKPFVLTSGRVRDQWHTMTRTGLVSKLTGHVAEPFLELHPLDAAQKNIQPASIVQLQRQKDQTPILLRALITPRVSPGVGFVPMHFSSQQTGAACINTLFAPHPDPISGQPELKHTTTDVQAYAASWYGFALSRSRPADPGIAYWCRMRTAKGWRLELADAESTEFEQLFKLIAGPHSTTVSVQCYKDEARGTYRFAAFEANHLVAALFIAREPVAIPRLWATGLLTRALSADEQSSILSGRNSSGKVQGALICSCHAVDSESIAGAVRAGADSVEAVGRVTNAGSGCGSCRMEIRQIIERTLNVGPGAGFKRSELRKSTTLTP